MGSRQLNSRNWTRLRLNFYVGMIHAKVEARPSSEVHLCEKGILKKMVGVQPSGVHLTWYQKKLSATNYAPFDRRDSFRFCTSDLIGNHLAWYHKKLSEANYAPSDKRETCFTAVRAIWKIGRSTGMEPEIASRGEVRDIRQTRNLFRSCTRDLKNRGFNWHGNAKSYPRRFTRHPADASIVSLMYT